jgi:hypothetical protein
VDEQIRYGCWTALRSTIGTVRADGRYTQQGEFNAYLQGIQMAIDLGIRRLIVETDAEDGGLGDHH